MNVKNRFLKYVSYDTVSDPYSESYPSTEHQKVLGAALAEELKGLGLADARMDSYGYVTATLPANTPGNQPVVSFCAHMDTSCDISGKDVKAKVIKYEGGDIVLNEQLNIVMRSEEFDNMKSYIGHDLIITDGTTLLGADDKAGIAEIMAAIEYLVQNPQIKHAAVKVLFTPDEEIGKGTTFFDVKQFGADACYTVDGGYSAELQYENFNAASAVVDILGFNIHPGTAKNKMVNSITLGMEFHALLPEYATPENTSGYEGFSHLNEIGGTVENTTLRYIIRDHSKELFEQKKQMFKTAEEFMNRKYGHEVVRVTLKDSYVNMKEYLLPSWHIVENAEKAMRELGMEPVSTPIRGGTDGSSLTQMGLPCPNLGTGSHNHHGKFEYASVQSMENTAKLIVKIIELYGKM